VAGGNGNGKDVGNWKKKFLKTAKDENKIDRLYDEGKIEVFVDKPVCIQIQQL
jgi:hypothetical protein